MLISTYEHLTYVDLTFDFNQIEQKEYRFQTVTREGRGKRAIKYLLTLENHFGT